MESLPTTVWSTLEAQPTLPACGNIRYSSPGLPVWRVGRAAAREGSSPKASKQQDGNSMPFTSVLTQK